MHQHSFEQLVRQMAHLRGPDGCPWDKKQTHQSLKQCLIEETYEVIEAIDENNPDKLKDELGDLLYQIIFHAQIATDNNLFSIDEVIKTVTEKMKRRHPHVFAPEKKFEQKNKSPEEILDRWHQIKREENSHRHRKSVTDGIPKHLPALMQAQKIQKAVSRVGFDWKKTEEVMAKVQEEWQEVQAAYTQWPKTHNRSLCQKTIASPKMQPDALQKQFESEPQQPALQTVNHTESKTPHLQLGEELGDLLFAVVNLCRFLGFEAEELLRKTNNKFITRFKQIEEQLAKQGKDIHTCTLEEMDKIWNSVKK